MAEPILVPGLQKGSLVESAGRQGAGVSDSIVRKQIHRILMRDDRPATFPDGSRANHVQVSYANPAKVTCFAGHNLLVS